MGEFKDFCGRLLAAPRAEKELRAVLEEVSLMLGSASD